MLLLILAYIGGIVISAVVLSVIIAALIIPVFLKFRSGSPQPENSAKRNILIIGDGASGRQLAQEVLKHNKPNIQLAGFIVKNNDTDTMADRDRKVLGSMDQLEDIISAYEVKEVVISEDNEDLNYIFDTVERCRKTGAKVKVSSKKLEIIEKKIKPRRYYNCCCVDLSKAPEDRFKMVLKRIVDLTVGSVAILILLPLMIFVALLVKITSPGEILFKQLRVGRNGTQFKMYKFRTMYSTGSEDEGRKKMMIEFMKNNKTAGDDKKVIDESRVTKVGKILRKTSLDELPQLLNVLKGEMSLVGPRPCVPYEYENYEKWQKRRVEVLPGCTGVWQVSGRSSVSFNDSVILDLYYVHNMSVLLDIMLLIKTIPVMLFSRGGR